MWSSGHEEWEHILGKWSVWIYHLMYLIVTSGSEVIVCHSRLGNKKSHLVSISRLDNLWFQNHKKVLLDKVRFLYVGRMSPEKGIFKFLDMYEELNFNTEFSIVGSAKSDLIKNKKTIQLLGYVSAPNSLISIYDNHNIVVLPSFTEGYPYVVDESLSRKRPVIVFEDIDYIVRDKKGIYVSKRDVASFSKTVKYIIDNYPEVQRNIEKNNLPTRESMLKQISNIIGT